MDYNSSRVPLKFPEYGRNIHNMVSQLLDIEDRNKRTRNAYAIINVMGNLNPHLRDVNDFKHKLWDHLHIMSDFKLDIDAPYPKPTPESLEAPPEPLPYNMARIKYRHFGRVINRFIEKVQDYEPGFEREALKMQIANHMKKSYVLWNKDSIDDEVIFEAIKDISEGQVKINEDDMQLTASKDFTNKGKRRRSKK